MRSSFSKIFVFVAGLTFVSWGLALGFSSLAGDEAFPKSLFTKIEKNLNKGQAPISETQTWNLKSIKRIEVNTRDSDVEVETLEVKNLHAALNGTAEVGTVLVLTESDGTLAINAKGLRKEKWAFHGFNFEVTSSLKLKITIPKNFEGEIVVHTASGDMKLDNVTLKAVTLQSASGDVEVSGGIQDLSTNTVSGDVEVADLKSKKFTFETISGDISTKNLSGTEGRIKTISGSLKLGLEQKSQWKIDVATISGDIEGELPELQSRENDRHASFGNGPHTLDISSVSGDVKFR